MRRVAQSILACCNALLCPKVGLPAKARFSEEPPKQTRPLQGNPGPLSVFSLRPGGRGAATSSALASGGSQAARPARMRRLRCCSCCAWSPGGGGRQEGRVQSSAPDVHLHTYSGQSVSQTSFPPAFHRTLPWCVAGLGSALSAASSVACAETVRVSASMLACMASRRASRAGWAAAKEERARRSRISPIVHSCAGSKNKFGL